MRQVFIKREGNPRLLLVFAGWGADEKLFCRPVAEGYDCLVCFDYRTAGFDCSLLEGYQGIRLLAWSMGVWAVGRALARVDFPWEMKLAVNGTPWPLHDEKGIPVAVFGETLRRFSEKTLARFRRRICGSAESVKEFLSHCPYRPAEELREELAALWRDVQAADAYPFEWDRAVVGSRDKVFPPANQRRAWSGTEIVETDVEHYDTLLFNRLMEGRGEEWTRR